MKKIFTLFAALAMVMSMSAKPYLRGSFNSWGTGNEFQNGECTINLAANTKYEFKVDNNGDWSTSYGGAAITSTKCTDVSCSGSNNATIQTTLKGSYTFKWNASTKKISVVYPTEEVIKPKKDITVKAKMPASWTKTIDAWVWTDEDPNGKAVTPEKDGDWYVITQNTAASYIIFRNGATWNGDANQTVDMCFEDNACIQLAQSGSSKATYTNIDCVSEFTITATANPAEGGSVTGAGVYEEGTTVTLTATANEGYEFVSWTNGGAEVSTNATYSFVIQANLALVANFKAVEATVYTISIEAVNGTVTGAGVYEEGATVTLTATPADGYNFKNWTVSGAEVSAENPYIFTATADVTVTANFEEIPVEYETVYFVNAQDWEKVCIYTWTPEIGTWPGKEMTKEAEQIGGKDVYSYTIEKGTTFVGLNFNNGNNGKQTGDLTWTAGKYYVIDNWYTKEEAEEKLAVPVPTYDYYVVGTFNSWANPDPNHGMTLVGDVYKATVTLNVGANMLKVTNGTWDNAKGFDAMGAEYEEVSNDTKDGNILITLSEGKDVVVVYNATTGKVTFEGLTEKVVVTPDVITYVLMGVGGDWTTGVSLTQNPENANEYMLVGQTISEGDAVKVVTLANGEKSHYCGNVDKWSAVAYTNDGDGNIVLAPGKYDFYYKVAEDSIYIGLSGYNTMEMTLTNLQVQEYEGDIVELMASDDANTGLMVDLWVTKEGDLLEDSYLAISQGWMDTELPIYAYTTFTKVYDEDLATDVYSGFVIVENMGGYLGLQLTMYAKPIVVTDVVVTDATITVDTEDDGMGGTYENITVSANWNESVLVIEGVEKAHEGFIQIKEIFEVDGEEDWYIWMCMNGVITTVDNVLTVTGEFNNNWTGDVYNVTISGTLPGGATTALDNIDATVAPVKVINNGQLIIIRNGVQYNAQGAILK